MIQENVFEWAKERGYKVGFAGIGILENIKNRLARRKTAGEFAPGFYEENLAFSNTPTAFSGLPGRVLKVPEGLSGQQRAVEA